MTDSMKWKFQIPSTTSSLEMNVPAEIRRWAGLLRELVAVNLARGDDVVVAEVLSPTGWSMRTTDGDSDGFLTWLDETAIVATDRLGDNRGPNQRTATFDIFTGGTEAGRIDFHIPEILGVATVSTAWGELDSAVLGLTAEEEVNLHARVFGYALHEWHTDREYIELYTLHQAAVQEEDQAYRTWNRLKIAFAMAQAALLSPTLTIPGPPLFTVGRWLYVPCTDEQLATLADIPEVTATRTGSPDPNYAIISVTDTAPTDTYYAVIHTLGYSTLPDIEAELTRIKSLKAEEILTARLDEQ
ncbi:hypothetical protein [Tsukamurella strandjordii]|uniref:hypothetical protein n=1 Tax=Tsukamurella strandjordii TaxID=147577 RepID=UPI0031D04C25